MQPDFVPAFFFCFAVVHLRRVVSFAVDGVTKKVTYQTSFSKAQLPESSYNNTIVIEMDFPAMEYDERTYNVVFPFTYWLGAMGGAFSLASVLEKVFVFLFWQMQQKTSTSAAQAPAVELSVAK
jgi:hypothetical protein